MSNCQAHAAMMEVPFSVASMPYLGNTWNGAGLGFFRWEDHDLSDDQGGKMANKSCFFAGIC